jgi:hypothetical protein
LAQTEVGTASPAVIGSGSKSKAYDTEWTPSQLPDAGSAQITAGNLLNTIWGLNFEMVNGSTGLRRQLADLGVNVSFANKSLDGAYAESYPIHSFGSGKITWQVNIDSSKLAGSKDALCLILAHELTHGVTFSKTFGGDIGKYNSAVDAASVAADRMNHAEVAFRAGSISKAGLIQARNSYYFGTATEGPSYRAEQAAWEALFGR